jgi:hypothetical protein
MGYRIWKKILVVEESLFQCVYPLLVYTIKKNDNTSTAYVRVSAWSEAQHSSLPSREQVQLP